MGRAVTATRVDARHNRHCTRCAAAAWHGASCHLTSALAAAWLTHGFTCTSAPLTPVPTCIACLLPTLTSLPASANTFFTFFFFLSGRRREDTDYRNVAAFMVNRHIVTYDTPLYRRDYHMTVTIRRLILCSYHYAITPFISGRPYYTYTTG